MTKTCKYPSCDNEVGQDPSKHAYRENRFCSVKCDVKYDHIKADARDARLAEQQEREEPDQI